MDLRLPVALLLLAGGGAVAGLAERTRETPRPPAGAASLLGGFTAIAAQAVWLQADRAILARDEDRAIVLLRTLVDLEPQVVSAARYAAQEIGWNMLQGRDEPGLRWGLVREALAILDGSVAANPGSAEALRNRGRYTVLKVAAEPELAVRFAAFHRGMTAAESALADLVAAFAADPSDSETAGALPLAAWPVGFDRIRSGRWDDAASTFRAAVGAYDRVLADARDELGAELEVDGPARAAFEGILEARERAAAVLAVCESAPDARPAAVEALRARFPDLGL